MNHGTILDDVKANQSLKEAWEQEDNKDELKIDLQGPERRFWLGTEAGRLGDAIIFLVKHGREMDQHTKEEWVRAASVSSNRISALGSKWAEKRKESTIHTPRMTYEWQDEGVKRVSTRSKAVRNAMRKRGAEFQRQKALNRDAGNWSKDFLHTTDTGVARI